MFVLRDRTKKKDEKKWKGQEIKGKERKKRKKWRKRKIRKDRGIERVSWAYLKGGGPVQLGSVYCVRRNICNVRYELLQKVAALLQVGGVYDHLHQLDANIKETNTQSNTVLSLAAAGWLTMSSPKRQKSNAPLNMKA